MNIRTTAILALFLASLLFALYVFRPDLKEPSRESAKPEPAPTRRDVLEKKPGEITKVVIELKGKEPWVFEKQKPDGGSESTVVTWRMTAPLDIPVAAFEAERVNRELTRLQYEMSYKPGEPGAPDDAAAGLSPPEAVVTLIDAGNASTVVEVGRPVSEHETYVRVRGDDRIMVAQSNLRRVFKAKPIEYRDAQAFHYAPENVTRLEITDRSNPSAPIQYVLVRDGSKWMMESPVVAAGTSKVDEIVRAISRLRVSQWHDRGREKLAALNLDPAPFTVTMTIEEPEIKEADSEKKDAESEEQADEEGAETGDEKKQADAPPQPPKTRRFVRTLHVSNRSPIGDDGKFFARIDDEDMIATILKVTADKVKPDITQLRDMSVTPVAIDKVQRIDISTGGSSGALVQKDAQWFFETDSSPADDAGVKELLRAIDNMNAIGFVEAKTDALGEFGLASPQAIIRLSGPGLDQPEQLVVGGYSDPQTKRVIYVRRGESQSIAKVRVDDAAPLLRPASYYQDRTLVEWTAERIGRIRIQRSDQGISEEVTLQRSGGTWTFSAPAAGALREDRVQKLATSLGGLRASDVVGNPAAISFVSPSVTVELTSEASAISQSSQATNHNGTDQSKSLSLAFTSQGDKVYAKCGDKPAVYEVTRDLFDQLIAEYRKPDIFTFDTARVKAFSIRHGEQKHAFTKAGANWTYASEPGLPLDAKKVENLLLQVKDLKTERYVRCTTDDASSLGLGDAAHEVRVEPEEGDAVALLVSDQTGERFGDKGHYAMLKGGNEIFLLTPEMLKRTEVSLGELEKK